MGVKPYFGVYFHGILEIKLMSNEFDSIVSEVGPKLASIQAEHVTMLSRITLQHSDKDSYILSAVNSTA